jgi:hypothetical protein
MSNAFRGDLPQDMAVEQLVEHVLFNLLLCHRVHVVAERSGVSFPVHVLAYRFVGRKIVLKVALD